MKLSVCVCVYFQNQEAALKQKEEQNLYLSCVYVYILLFCFRCESVSSSLNANLENYFREAIIHLTSPQVQFQNLVLPQAKHSTTSQDELQEKILH